MPRGWTRKDERLYEHVKESEEARGVSGREAEEIAGRTVNKHRRQEGRTPNRATRGTGNPNRPLAGRTRDELRDLAREKEVEGRSKMSKAELVRALEKR